MDLSAGDPCNTTNAFPEQAPSTPDIFFDPTIADAILDRLIHSAHKINLKGGSMRKKTFRLDLTMMPMREN
jgi:hypothetical protein